MARTKQEVVQEQKPEIDEEAVSNALVALDTVNQMQQVQDSALEVGKLVGRVETVLFMRACGDRVIAETFIQLKEGRKYKGLSIRDESGNVRPCADLKEACEFFLGKSYRACAEIVQNYELLGSDLYDKSLQLGLQRNDFRAIRALPADDQTLIESALGDSASREAVADLIETLTERHAAKLAESKAALAESKDDADAKDRIIQNKIEREGDLLKKIARYEGDKVPADERLETVVAATEESGKALEDSLRGMWVAFEAADTVSADIFEKPLSEQDAVGARAAVARIRDAINRAAHSLAELQFNCEQRLEPVLAGHEDFLLRAGSEG
jgi:hypothetical protein